MTLYEIAVQLKSRLDGLTFEQSHKRLRKDRMACDQHALETLSREYSGEEAWKLYCRAEAELSKKRKRKLNFIA